VQQGDVDGDGGHVAVQGAVVGLVRETVRPQEEQVRRVGERAVGVQAQRAVRRPAHQHGGEGGAVHVAGSAQGAWGRDQRREGGGGVVTVIDGDRGVVDRCDRERDGGRGTGQHAVAGLVRERVRAVEVGGRRVGEGTVGVQRQRPVGRAGHQYRRQGIPVGVV